MRAICTTTIRHKYQNIKKRLPTAVSTPLPGMTPVYRTNSAFSTHLRQSNKKLTQIPDPIEYPLLKFSIYLYVCTKTTSQKELYMYSNLFQIHTKPDQCLSLDFSLRFTNCIFFFNSSMLAATTLFSDFIYVHLL